MSSTSEQLLRRLLPRFFWLRDAEDGGGLLDAIVRSLAGQYDGLRTDVDLLYDQFFIATCDPAYIPLIGDEIGVSGLSPMTGPGVGDRALVGRTIQLRRRKGSLATAARGVIAASGWPTYIQEGRAAVTATASVRDPGTRSAGFVDISGTTPAAQLGQPWASSGRTATTTGRAVVAGEPGAGRAGRAGRAGTAGFPSPATVSLHVWRLVSFPVTGRTATPARDAPARLAGRALRLDPFGRDIRLFAVPSPPIDRELPPSLGELPLPLTALLLEQLLASTQPAPVQISGCKTLAVGDLSEWRRPPRLGQADAVVDPQLGRVLLATKTTANVTVSYAYGFPGEIGGGPYGTADDYSVLPAAARMIQVAQDATGSEQPDGTYSERTIEAAVSAADGHNASIVIVDSGTYAAAGGRWDIVVPDGKELRIASAPEAAPVLEGEFRARVGRQSRLELSGIAIGGALILDGQGEVAIEHCTLAPESGRDSVRGVKEVAVSVSFSILGGLKAGDLSLTSSIVDGPITCAGSLDAEQVTVLADVAAPTLNAGDCIFTGALAGDRGLVRTSYLGEGAGNLPMLGCTGPQDGVVRFASTRWGDSDYCQLSLLCPRSVAAGAAQGSEMGAFNWLGQPARFARVPVVLQELLPAGIGASVTYVN